MTYQLDHSKSHDLEPRFTGLHYSNVFLASFNFIYLNFKFMKLMKSKIYFKFSGFWGFGAIQRE